VSSAVCLFLGVGDSSVQMEEMPLTIWDRIESLRAAIQLTRAWLSSSSLKTAGSGQVCNYSRLRSPPRGN
jgi:hypothetical protein